MSESLEDRLRSHAKAFDGLLQLIPAKYYYGEDTSDQWQRKKQTKEEARNAKLAKLDPDNAKSAKDVMEENARKRKREEEDGSGLETVGVEQPKEGLKAVRTVSKKQKRGGKAQHRADAVEKETFQPSELAGQKKTKSAKRKEKNERKKAKGAATAAKKQAQKARKQDEAALAKGAEVYNESEVHDIVSSADEAGELDQIDVNGIAEETSRHSPSTISPSPPPEFPALDLSTGESGSSSISSIVPPPLIEPRRQLSEEPKKTKADPEELKARLQKRIDDLRAARKADGLNGSPARNRQELMEARRRKEEQRRAHKKELRQTAKREEQRTRDEALASRNSPASGSNAGPMRKRDAGSENNFSFGRIAFDDGEQMDAGLSTVLDPRKRKGPQDSLTAIKAAESKQKRINSLDEAKRTDIEEKDVWLTARKRAHGERVRDDTSLLKKTLKRKEKAKQKSEKEWKERLEGVEKGKAMRQKKREENLRKRRDEKGVKGKRKGGKGAKSAKSKPRPGFEGSFRAKVGGGGPRKK
ncbi:MAG: hypothetical protein M1830_000800 [Pleopsidium flavum]|nr:MAG: hypothetical protein M1830_000800 [Pleopsidium flavum]